MHKIENDITLARDPSAVEWTDRLQCFKKLAAIRAGILANEFHPCLSIFGMKCAEFKREFSRQSRDVLSSLLHPRDDLSQFCSVASLLLPCLFGLRFLEFLLLIPDGFREFGLLAYQFSGVIGPRCITTSHSRYDFI